MEKCLRTFLSLIILSLVFAINDKESESESDNAGRKGKFLGLNVFTIVRFPNSVCAGDAINGTCYSAEDCAARGGVNSGVCAGGYGVCCTCKIQLCIIHMTAKYIPGLFQFN